MTDHRVLTTGEPVPEDGSHREIDPTTGMQEGYVVLSAEERAKGFVKPVRHVYTHNPCGYTTRVSTDLAETYARNPSFYSGTFCVDCRAHFPLDQFTWCDGEPMDVAGQARWAIEQAQLRERHRLVKIALLEDELAHLKAQAPRSE